jgi:predicted secreted Zn-dependent protease
MADIIELEVVGKVTGLKPMLATVSRLEREIVKSTKALDQNKISQARYNKVLTSARAEYRGLGVSAQKAYREVGKMANATKLASAAQTKEIALNKQYAVARREATAANARHTAEKKQAKAVSDQAIATEERLKNKFVQGYAAMDIYTKELRDLTMARKAGIISTEQQTAAIERLNIQMANGSGSFSTYGSGVAGATQKQSKLGVVAQQTGYQVGDFLVQIQSGANPMMAFGQQATQLVGVMSLFGPKLLFAGAALGIIIPLLTAVAGYFLRSKDAAKGAGGGVHDFEERLKSAREEVKGMSEDLRLMNSGFENTAELTLDDSIKLAQKNLAEARAVVTRMTNDAASKNTGVGGNTGNEYTAAFAGQIAEYEEVVKLRQEELASAIALRELLEAQTRARERDASVSTQLHEERQRQQREAYEAGREAYEQRQAFIAEGLANISDVSQTAANAAAEVNEKWDTFFGTVNNLRGSLGEAAFEAMRLSGVDMSMPITDAMVEAAELAGDLGISFDLAKDINNSSLDSGILDGVKAAQALATSLELAFDIAAAIENQTDPVGRGRGLGPQGVSLDSDAPQAGDRYGFKRQLDNLYKVKTATNKAGGAADSAADDFDKLRKELEKETRALEEAANPMLAYNDSMARLNKLLKDNSISSGAYTKAVDDLNKGLIESHPIVDGVADAFQDFMERGFRDFSTFADDILDLFKNMLIEMAMTALRNKILIPMVMGKPSGGGGIAGQVAGAASGGGSFMSSLGAGGGIAGSALSGGAGLVTSMMGGGGMAGAGTYMSAVLGTATTSLGAFAAAAGAVALPLLAVAAVFMAFKKKTRELDAGIRVSVDGMESLVEGFKKIQTSRFFGLSKKVADEFEAMDAETADPLQNAVNGVLQNVFNMATGLGVAASAFNDFTTSMIVSTKGMDEAQYQTAITDMLRDIGVEFARMATDLFEFQRHGENAAMILDRLNTSVSAANSVLSTLGLRVFELTLGGANASSVFIDLFGGIEQLTSSTSSYYENFFSGAEKAATITGQMTDALDQLGLNLPRTRDQFRQLIEAQDMTTDSGRNTVAALLQLSGVFDQLTTQLDKDKAALANSLGVFASGISDQKDVIGRAVDALVEPLEAAIDRTRVNAEKSYQIFKTAADKTVGSARDIVNTIRRALDSRTIISEAGELQRYQQSQQQLASFAGGASFNDTSLKKATEGVSIDSQKFFGSFEDYSRDFYKTQISLTKLAEKAEGELSDVEKQIDIAEKAYQIAQGTYQEAKDFNVALDTLLFDLASFTETSARNQPFIDQIKAEGERQVTLLDAILMETTKQVKGLLGIETNVADLVGSNVSVSEALGVLGIEEGKMAGAVLALDVPVGAIGTHIAALDTSLGGAYDRLGITLSDLESLNLASSFDVVNLAAPFGLVDLSAPFKKLDLTGALETKVKSLGDNVVLFSGALTTATGGLGINVTNLGTTIAASMTTLGTFLTSLAASVDGLATAQAAVPTVPTPVIDLYTDVLKRTPDELGLEYWRSTGLTGQALEDAFRQGAVNSGEVNSLDDLDKITGLAGGGMHSGGMRLVGENGPELEVTGPSRIYSSENTKSMLSGNSSNSSELVEEIRSLKLEVKGLRSEQLRTGTQLSKYTKKTYDLERQWDIVGLPPTRAA